MSLLTDSRVEVLRSHSRLTFEKKRVKYARFSTSEKKNKPKSTQAHTAFVYPEYSDCLLLLECFTKQFSKLGPSLTFYQGCFVILFQSLVIFYMFPLVNKCHEFKPTLNVSPNMYRVPKPDISSSLCAVELHCRPKTTKTTPAVLGNYSNFFQT